MRLSRDEVRVIGSLIEKELTTPQQYPLTLNALLLACNQSSNREPVLDLDERTVERALVALKTAGLVRFVHPSHGRSVTRYRQLLNEQLGLSQPQLALLGSLMLRGPQTAGELRSRTERMRQFEHMREVELELENLGRLEPPVVVRLPRRPGQKEERWGHRLDEGPAPLDLEAPAEVPPRQAGPPAHDDGGREATSDLTAQVAELRADIAELRRQVAELRARERPQA